MQRHKNFGAWTYVLLTLLTFALKIAVFNCDLTIKDNTPAKLTANLMNAVRSNWDRIISPALVQGSLIVAALGGKNGSITQKELQLAAQVSGSKDDLATKLRQLSAAVNLENYFYVNSHLELNTKFAQRTKNVPVDFVQFNECAKTTINDFVARRTKNRLQKDKRIVQQTKNDGNTTMIAINLINFSDDWKTPFIRSSNNGNVRSMYTYGTFLYGKLKALNVSAVVLPFKRSNTRMLLLFADESDSLIPLEKRLKKVDVTKIPSVLRYKKKGLSVPMFRTETVYSLCPETLQKMNVKTAVSRKAELHDFFNKNEENILNLFHQFSYIKVDMNGVEFASALSAQYVLTSSVYPPSSNPEVYKLNGYRNAKNPFFYYIIKGKNVLAAGSSYNGR